MERQAGEGFLEERHLNQVETNYNKQFSALDTYKNNLENDIKLLVKCLIPRNSDVFDLG